MGKFRHLVNSFRSIKERVLYNHMQLDSGSQMIMKYVNGIHESKVNNLVLNKALIQTSNI